MPPYEVLKSEKNRDVLLVEGFLFWFDRATPRGRKYWKCIYCYRGHDGIAEHKCLSRVITSPDEPEAIMCKAHNHEMDKVLVEHMKAFGSIRRLASSLRTSHRARISKFAMNSAPSTSVGMPLDLSAKRFNRKQLTPPNNTKNSSISNLLDNFHTPPTVSTNPTVSPGISANLFALATKLGLQYPSTVSTPSVSTESWQNSSSIFPPMAPMFIPTLFPLTNPLLTNLATNPTPFQIISDQLRPLNFDFAAFAAAMTTAVSIASHVGSP